MDSFRTAGEIVTGVGSVSCVGDRAAHFGSRALVVTGRSAMRAAGVLDAVVGYLDGCDVEEATFDEVGHDPDVVTVDHGRAFCRDVGCDVVIGLGGGSAMDAAKAIAGLANHDEPASAFHDGHPITATTLPLIAIPTTSGTGAEVTRNAVISDRERCIKKSIRADSMMPAVAIVDPRLTVTCPQGVTAASGMDALVQAIEAFTSRHATGSWPGCPAPGRTGRTSRRASSAPAVASWPAWRSPTRASAPSTASRIRSARDTDSSTASCALCSCRTSCA